MPDTNLNIRVHTQTHTLSLYPISNFADDVCSDLRIEEVAFTLTQKGFIYIVWTVRRFGDELQMEEESPEFWSGGLWTTTPCGAATGEGDKINQQQAFSTVFSILRQLNSESQGEKHYTFIFY